MENSSSSQESGQSLKAQDNQEQLWVRAELNEGHADFSCHAKRGTCKERQWQQSTKANVRAKDKADSPGELSDAP